MDLGKVSYNLIIPCFFFQKAIIKSPHFTHPAFILVNCIIYGENGQAVEAIILSTDFEVFHRFSPRNCAFYRFKAENGASVLVFLAVKKRKSTPAFSAAGHEKQVLKEPIDHSEARF